MLEAANEGFGFGSLSVVRLKGVFIDVASIECHIKQRLDFDCRTSGYAQKARELNFGVTIKSLSDIGHCRNRRTAYLVPESKIVRKRAGGR